jgi:hypothetical protein
VSRDAEMLSETIGKLYFQKHENGLLWIIFDYDNRSRGTVIPLPVGLNNG